MIIKLQKNTPVMWIIEKQLHAINSLIIESDAYLYFFKNSRQKQIHFKVLKIYLDGKDFQKNQ